MKLLAFLVAIAATAMAAYPSSPRCGVMETYFGTSVPDPYRWLEDMHASKTRTWVAAQTGLLA